MAEAGYDVEGQAGKGCGLVPEGEVGGQGRLSESKGGEREDRGIVGSDSF